MRTRYRYDAELEAVVEIRPQSNYFEEEQPKGPNLIPDTLPGGVNGMRSMTDGKQVDSKSAYYADLKARGLAVEEPGMVAPKPQTTTREYQQAAADAHYGRYDPTPHLMAAYNARNRK